MATATGSESNQTESKQVRGTPKGGHMYTLEEVDQVGFDRPDLSWQADANCVGVDPDIFFPERGTSTKEAKSICKACVACERCLNYALDNGEKFGIWGGTSERERRRLRRVRAVQLQENEPDTARRVAV